MRRREFILATAAAIAADLAPAAAASGTLQRLAGEPISPDPRGRRPTLAQFYRLCQWVTHRLEPDREVARIFYPVFVDEPWGPKHILTALRQIEDAQTDADAAEPVWTLIEQRRLGDGEAWFVSHLLTTWYLGVYYHETRTERLIYDQALMWERLRRWAVIPGVPLSQPIAWHLPPQAHE